MGTKRAIARWIRSWNGPRPRFPWLADVLLFCSLLVLLLRLLLDASCLLPTPGVSFSVVAGCPLLAAIFHCIFSSTVTVGRMREHFANTSLYSSLAFAAGGPPGATCHCRVFNDKETFA